MLERCDWLAIASIVASLLTAVLGFYAGYAARRPRIRLTGGGSVSSPVGQRDLMLSNLSFFNDPSFLGIRVGREAARFVSASVYDTELQEYVGPNLRWGMDASTQLSSTRTLESGTQAVLYVFAKDRFADEFFVYDSQSLSTEPPRSSARYTNRKKKFGLLLCDSIGRKYRFKLTVRNTDQSVTATQKLRLRDRLRRWLRRL